MEIGELTGLYANDERIRSLSTQLDAASGQKFRLRGMTGSAQAVVVSSVFAAKKGIHLIIQDDRESAAYFFNDLENLLGEQNADFFRKNVLFYPSSFTRSGDFSQVDNTSVLLRTEALNKIQSGRKGLLVVTWPEAIAEKVVKKHFFEKNTLRIREGDKLSIDFIADIFNEYHFERMDFVVVPGQYSVRGGIVDVYSFSNDKPYRIEFDGDTIASLRSFDPATQLSVDKLDHIKIVPDIQNPEYIANAEPIWAFLPQGTIAWFNDIAFCAGRVDAFLEKATLYQPAEDEELPEAFISRFVGGNELLQGFSDYTIIESGRHFYFENAVEFAFNIKPQPSFNKNFDLLITDLRSQTAQGFKNIICSDSKNQLERIWRIIDDIVKTRAAQGALTFEVMNTAVHEGFIDNDLKLCCYTDHQIFDRYHRFRLMDKFNSKEAVTLKEIYNLKPGDYVTHIDHGVGRYGGLEKVMNNGKEQEVIRIVYANNDLLYVSIHSLHRISKYVNKEGTPPTLNRLGSNAWNKLKNKTKQKVKDIARDLIKLYAERKKAEGFAFAPDNYLQHELEASFIYQDTPDQVKATADVKKDMQAECPMDRLICGDVGFGKTEVAIRAAFKSVNDSKQVAVLVPTTILALQHYKTFVDRLKEFPCKVEYINRFRSAKQQKETLKDVESGRTDILIGTHRIVSQDVKFKDLGLLIIDEEQKFGVAVKEKLRKMKVNVDTLTLTATPIPRTLQFSLMGARDLSVITTPPPNRYPIQTELRTFNEEMIREAIMHEVSRGGQVFFVHNRVQNIQDVADLISKLCPGLKVITGHGQMDGKKLEETMLAFIEGYYDVLVSTTIIESGLDIPNVNTIIINEAQNYGLSDLHQLRGRVGRSNRKAFCYLLTPPLSVLSEDARKRLKAIEEFSDLGSGFNIAMRDLDIRGAGNILGGEQSGFISEIGFEMYHKILDEAIAELKETDFKELFSDEKTDTRFVKDCLIETDLEILIPDFYISNIAERLILYKELDSISDETGLQQFAARLDDRFGPLPPQTEELLNTLRLRWIASRAGMEKIVLRNNQFSGYFVYNQASLYYQSATFTTVLKYIQAHPSYCRIKEQNNKLILTMKNITSISQALRILGPLAAEV